MNPERWKQIEEMFHAAIDHEPSARAAYLAQTCDGDDSLRTELEGLLACHHQVSRLFDYPPADLAAALLTRSNYQGTISHYRIVKKIGIGGMGEVYLAEDSRLNRKVALKILPPHFSKDPDRLRRFEQEARAAGMLNHPNIVAIYDTGTNNGSPYIVSELLQGVVLQQKLGGRPFPLQKAIDYALQIAKGLSAAHEKGIIHRDLKPGNIFITKEGHVKILDFGLAKLIHPETSNSTSAPSEISDLTESGVLLGTIVYMSPEQVTGRKVDRRSDIFAFGSVFYEMLCGKRPFGGETQIEVMHAILKADPPPLSQSNANIPVPIEGIVRHCLEKDPDHRFQSTSDLAFALESLSSISGTSVVPLRQTKLFHLALGVVGILALIATILGVALYQSRSRTPQESSSAIQRLSVVLPQNTVLNSSAISPDGQRLAYVINGTTGFSKLWLRSMDSPEAEEITGTEDATLPFWSPDSKSIGFFTEQKLKTVTIGGGPPKTLFEGVELAKGGTWNQYGDIVFAASGEGLYRISAQGGETTLVTMHDRSREEVRHMFPQFLPDGRHFLYFVRSFQKDSRTVYMGSLDSTERKLVLSEQTPVRFIHPGYLFFVRNNKLMVEKWDNKQFRLAGNPVLIADNSSNDTSGPNFSVSENVLVYGSNDRWSSQPIWFDRSGKQMNSFGDLGEYRFYDLSGDNKSLLTFFNGLMWMVDLSTHKPTRFAMTNEFEAVFSPDGSQVAYAESGDLYRRRASGTGKAELLYSSAGGIKDVAWSADGMFLTFTTMTLGPKTLFDLWALPLNGDRQAFGFLQTDAREESAALSPDGKWVAYQSYDSGRSEIYVRSFPVEAGGVWAISTGGGEKPLWNRNGKELFYLTLDKKLMATEVQTGEIFKAGNTRTLFQTHAQPRINTLGIDGGKQYFISSDGKYFLVNTLIDKTTPTEIHVLLNWKSLLEK
jgi:serine/threonine protein kinase